MKLRLLNGSHSAMAYLGLATGCNTVAEVLATLELALAGWVSATEPDPDGGQQFGTTDPAASTLAACWETSAFTAQRVSALLRAIGANDLVDEPDLNAAVAERVPAVRAGRMDISHGPPSGTSPGRPGTRVTPSSRPYPAPRIPRW